MSRTAKSVVENWTPPRRIAPYVELPEARDARMEWEFEESVRRWNELRARINRRRSLIRTANRKWRRQIGQNFRNA